jgi:hypothetical protein
MSCLWQAHADLLVEPDVSAFGFDDFQKALSLVKVGEEAARQVVPTFRAWAAERAAYESYLRESEQKKFSLTTGVMQHPVPLA